MFDYPPIEIIEIIIEANKNAMKAPRGYAIRFPERHHPNHIIVLSF